MNGDRDTAGSLTLGVKKSLQPTESWAPVD